MRVCEWRVGKWQVMGLGLVLLLAAAACSGDGLETAVPPTPSPIPSALPEPASDTIQFRNVAGEIGLDFQQGAFRWEMSGDPVAMMGGGLCWLDYDRDGWLDLYVVNSYAELEAGRWEAEGGLPRNGLFRNENGRFSDVSAGSGTDLAVRGNGCVAADFNLDGWPDIYITTARVNMLLWNNGDGTFTEGAEFAGVDAYGWQTAAVVGDLNDDGWPDLFVAGYVDVNNRIPDATMGFPNTHYGRKDLLYISEGRDPTGRVTFHEVGAAAGLQREYLEYGLGALFTDINGDGRLDLYVANDTNPNRLYVNVAWPGGRDADPEGIGFRFEEVGGLAGVADMNSGMGVAGGDYDGDGRFDLFTTNLGDQLHAVFRNQSGDGDLVFADATGELGVADIGAGWTGWGISWADIDLDSDLDLMVVNGRVPVTDPPHDTMLVQAFGNLTAQGQTGQFQELTQAVGLEAVGPFIGRGGAMADYDNDGDLDLALNTIGGQLALLQNYGGSGNWLEVELDGFHPGAVVSVTLPDGRTLKREIHAGSSFLSSEDPRCHFGLGTAVTVTELRVHWPDGSWTRLGNVAANQRLIIYP